MAGTAHTTVPVLPPDAALIATTLGLKPLPHEGGLYKESYKDAFSSAIYYMLVAPDFSALHKLDSVEVYHWYAGDPVQLFLLHADGTVEEPVLGPDVAAGQVPQFPVPGGVWQGSSSAGVWSFVGTTMSPGYTQEEFVLADRDEFVAAYPHAAERITALTRV
ncbi:cupin domain-containing protein [Glaciibacter psychrotolerans]